MTATNMEFEKTDKGVELDELFEPEFNTPIDLQEAICQSILENFKPYVGMEICELLVRQIHLFLL